MARLARVEGTAHLRRVRAGSCSCRACPYRGPSSSPGHFETYPKPSDTSCYTPATHRLLPPTPFCGLCTPTPLTCGGPHSFLSSCSCPAQQQPWAALLPAAQHRVSATAAAARMVAAAALLATSPAESDSCHPPSYTRLPCRADMPPCHRQPGLREAWLHCAPRPDYPLPGRPASRGRPAECHWV